jgi:hypothetical protein
MAVPTIRVARMPPVAVAAIALIAVQLVIRGVLAFQGYFYWDDLILVGRAGTQALFSPSYLFDDHDGHVMPGAFLVAGLLTHAAPLVWVGPAISMIALQLLASLSLLRALYVILGWRWVLLIPLCFALFTPLGVPAFAWWAAALNYLPMLAALSWVGADAVLFVRTGNRRYAVTGTLAYFGGLLFFEKSAVIPFVAFALVALLLHVQGDTRALSTAWRAGRPLWLTTLATTVVWVAVYLVVVNQQRWSWDLQMTWDLLARSVTHGIVPGLVGGPWVWHRWAPASPWAVPPVAAMIVGWIALSATVVVSLFRKRRIGAVWLVAVGYAIGCQVPIYLMRSSAFTALELAQTLRYLSDLVVVLALLAAVAFCAPNRPGGSWLDNSPARTAVVVGLASVFAASSAISTRTFLASWRDNPVQPYLHNALRGLAQARQSSDAALLDQEIDPVVLGRVAYPETLASHLFALIRDRPQFAKYTAELRTLDMHGQMVDAYVTWIRTIRPGPIPNCGYLVQTDAPVRMPLDGPMLPAEWTAEINYLANSEGSMQLSLSEGPETRVAVHPGLNRVYVRLPGAGDAITATANTSALSLCLASGPVGYVAPR